MIDFNLKSQETTAASDKPKRKRSPMGLVKLFVALLVIGALAGLGYMYYTTRQQLDMLSTPGGQQELSRQEVQRVRDSLSKLTILPEEDPLLATIIDAQYLATQSAFYQNAQNGDKLVVFSNARKAYIYSPSRNIIVNSGPLITNSDAQPQAGEDIEIEIRNGTSVSGLGNQIRSQVEGPGIVINTVGDAANRNYTQTQVIGLSSTVSAENLNLIAQRLNGRVVESLPNGENPSNADVLIIAGQATSTAPAATSNPTPTPEP